MRLNAASPRQIRAARALLRWTQGRLGQEAGLSTAAVARVEAGITDARVSTLEAILDVLEARGIAFVEEEGGGTGVFHRPPPRSASARRQSDGMGF